MNLNSKKTSLIILAITALVCSRALFFFINDPEGPNLLIVVVMAAIVYLVSLAAYFAIPTVTSRKKLLLAIVIQIAIVSGFFAFNSYIYNEKQAPVAAEYKNAAYQIDGASVELKNGIAETEAAPGSASKITTRYFGNDFKTDLNSDGREDVVFLLTQETGGSGIFYYVVAALNTERGYVGSDGYLLGDRIAPQIIEKSPNPKHVNVVVANFADRTPNEPMTAQPSVGKSAYLKLDTARMMWGIVEPNFEGEASAGPTVGN